MKEIQTNKGIFIFIEVEHNCVPKQIAHNIVNKPNSLILDFSVQLISTTNNVKEKEAEDIVDEVLYMKGFSKDHTVEYKNYFGGHSCSAYESFQTLLKFNDLYLSKNYLIIKKIKTKEQIIELANSMEFILDYDKYDDKEYPGDSSGLRYLRFVSKDTELDEPDLRWIWYKNVSEFDNIKKGKIIKYRLNKKREVLNFLKY